MRYRTLLIAGGVGLLSATATVHAQAQARSTPAFRLTEGKDVTFEARGLGVSNASRGKLDIDYKNGHAMLHLEMDSLVHPQRVGWEYTAYVLWGVTTDGKVARLGELPAGKKIDLKADFAAQTFGLIATAEPYTDVELPSTALVIRFTLANKADKDAPVVSRARYVGDNGDLYVTPDRTFAPDYTTPLLVLGARHAFEVARRAGAAEYAPTEWREVDVKLAALEQTWPDQRNDEAKFSGPAREVSPPRRWRTPPQHRAGRGRGRYGHPRARRGRRRDGAEGDAGRAAGRLVRTGISRQRWRGHGLDPDRLRRRRQRSGRAASGE